VTPVTSSPGSPLLWLAGGALAAAAGIAAVVAAVVAAGRRWGSAPDPCDGQLDLVFEGGDRFSVEVADGAVLDGVAIGEGPLVVLSHCWTGNRAVWSPVASRLVERGRRVVLYDQCGHGASTLGAGRLTVSRLGADLRAVLEAVDARSAVVVGHSMGGMAVQVLAIDHPEVVAERVSALVLVNTAAAGIGGASVSAALRRLVANPRAERLLVGPAGPALVRASVGRSPRLAHLVAIRDDFVATAPEVRLGYLAAMQDMDLRAGLGSIGAPTTVVVGRRDALTPHRLGRAIAKAVPGARLVEVPNGGHMLPYEEPDLVADLIAEAGTAPEAAHAQKGRGS